MFTEIAESTWSDSVTNLRAGKATAKTIILPWFRTHPFLGNFSSQA